MLVLIDRNPFTENTLVFDSKRVLLVDDQFGDGCSVLESFLGGDKGLEGEDFVVDH